MDRAVSYRWQVFVTTWMSYAGFYVTRRVISVVKGPMKAALHVDDLGVSHLFTIYLVAYMIGQFSAAWLSKRLPNRTQALLGMSVSIGVNLVVGVLLTRSEPGPYWAIAVLMAIHGLAQATGWPCNVGIMAAWTKRSERGRVMAFWATCYQLGAVFAKAMAAFLFGALGLLWSFWGSSAVLAIITLLFWFGARETPEKAGLPAMASEAVEADLEPPKSADAGTRERAARQQMFLILAMGMIYFAFKFLRYALDSWSVLLMSDRFHLSTSTAGYYSTTYDWVGFTGVILAGWLSDKLGSRLRVISIMSGLLVLCTIAMWQVGLSTPTTFAITLGMVGFTSMGPDALLSGAAAMDTGSRERAARAVGIINGCGSAGPIVQEPLVGYLKSHYGIESVMIVFVVVTAAAFIAIASFRWHLKRSGINL